MAYKTYTLEQVRRTSDMSHAVYQNVNNDFLNIVSQFGTNINSDYILRFGTVNYALTNSGTEYNQTLITSSNHSANAIPIQRITNLKKLTLSVKCTKSYSTSYSYIVFYMADVNDDGTHNYGHKKIFQRLPGNAPVDTYDDLKTFSDDNWHTYEFEWAEELHRNINYVSIEFNNCYGYVKDIVWETWGQDCTSNGGGATHIAKVTGQLKDLSSNLSDILIVSGGGGGGYLDGSNAYAGADAGGISGSGGNSADQSTGYAFGQGESGTNKSGGGSGYYGGYKGI